MNSLVHTHTEEFSQVASAWRSLKQNRACSALEVDSNILGITIRCGKPTKTLFTNKSIVMTAGFEQC